MINLGKKNVLGVYVDAVDYEAAVARIITAAKTRRNLTVTALAVHGVMTGALDLVQRYRLNHIDLITPDGQPVRWALNWLYGASLPDRVYGPTLMLKICEQASQERLPIFLFGSRLEIIQALQRNLLIKFPQLVFAGAEPSCFRRISIEEKQAIIHKIKSSGAGIVFVGLGCPRQEVWVFENQQYLSIPLIAVGAAFDFHAGLLSQAPAYLQRWGLEWFYRLTKEPKRLWKRYMLLNPMYAWYIFLQKTGIKHFDRNEVEPPIDELRFG